MNQFIIFDTVDGGLRSIERSGFIPCIACRFYAYDFKYIKHKPIFHRTDRCNIYHHPNCRLLKLINPDFRLQAIMQRGG